MIEVVGDAALREFRAYWTPQRVLNLVDPGGSGVVITYPPGIGKSFTADGVIETSLASDRYDLVIFAAPTHLILNERSWVRNPPEHVHTKVLRPRPRDLCSPARDTAWSTLETTGCAALGRRTICSTCPQDLCLWRDQYSRKRLNGIQALFITQAHLLRSPSFIRDVRSWTGAERVLLILDEDHVAMANLRKIISREDLCRFAEVLRYMRNGPRTAKQDSSRCPRRL